MRPLGATKDSDPVAAASDGRRPQFLDGMAMPPPGQIWPLPCRATRLRSGLELACDKMVTDAGARNDPLPSGMLREANPPPGAADGLYRTSTDNLMPKIERQLPLSLTHEKQTGRTSTDTSKPKSHGHALSRITQTNTISGGARDTIQNSAAGSAKRNRSAFPTPPHDPRPAPLTAGNGQPLTPRGTAGTPQFG